MICANIFQSSFIIFVHSYLAMDASINTVIGHRHETYTCMQHYRYTQLVTCNHMTLDHKSLLHYIHSFSMSHKKNHVLPTVFNLDENLRPHYYHPSLSPNVMLIHLEKLALCVLVVFFANFVFVLVAIGQVCLYFKLF